MAIVYYDGDCGYCNRAVMWVIDHKISTRFQFAQLEGVYGKNLTAVRPDLKNIDTIVVVDGDDVYIKSDAIVHLLRNIKNYQLLGWLLTCIPKCIRNFGYDLFAQIRHKLQFENECKLPTIEERKYFLD
ncbi:thiol-disulfide oxidoreductase DCC family protein [Mammaliicoccus vitulinus]|uniref:thiol-disulfide oxidoreductase DCC family protein n=1 Tax=Mammaliicoccus vitulinus TaxID=71237 RepID=UPI003BA0ED41